MVSKISNIILTIFIVFTLITAAALVLPKLFGYQIYGVLSGSMEPSFPVGSIVYVKEIKASEAIVGDPITFYIEGNDKVVATHRIIEINAEEKQFITKGDANEVVDAEPVSFHRLIGRAERNIPFLGYIAMYIQTKQGIIASIGVFLFIVFLSLLGDVLKKEVNKDSNNDLIIGTNVDAIDVKSKDSIVRENQELSENNKVELNRDLEEDTFYEWKEKVYVEVRKPFE